MIHLIVTHYSSIALMITLPVFATAFGQSRIAKAAFAALNQQPAHDAGIKKLFFAGIALSETVALIAVLATAYLFNNSLTHDVQTYTRIGTCMAIIIPCVIVAYFGSLSIVQALGSAARQPFLTNQILSFVLITQSLMQTPVIFCAIFALIIEYQASSVATLPPALQLFAVGLVLSLSSIGPCFGLSHFIAQACHSLRFNRAAFSKIFSFTFITQAIIETPFLFGLATGIVMLQLNQLTFMKSIALLSAAIALGGATLPVSIVSARASSKVLNGIALNPENTSILSRFSLFCQAFIDTTAVYGLIIALMLIIF
ncbi:MAG: ATP synthase F0 subunit C [Candidatus Babeliaceae bacterium]|nr:ATP synthase F0 subunit C [Candidatus Babeliaceae bacterium]